MYNHIEQHSCSKHQTVTKQLSLQNTHMRSSSRIGGNLQSHRATLMFEASNSDEATEFTEHSHEITLRQMLPHRPT
ncbi:hypothetical protein J6590_082574, partial [Homalodisca vitripennis]